METPMVLPLASASPSHHHICWPEQWPPHQQLWMTVQTVTQTTPLLPAKGGWSPRNSTTPKQIADHALTSAVQLTVIEYISLQTLSERQWRTPLVTLMPLNPNHLPDTIYNSAIIAFGKRQCKNTDWNEMQWKVCNQWLRPRGKFYWPTRGPPPPAHVMPSEVQGSRHSRPLITAPMTNGWTCVAKSNMLQTPEMLKGCTMIPRKQQTCLPPRLPFWRPQQGKSSQTRKGSWNAGWSTTLNCMQHGEGPWKVESQHYCITCMNSRASVLGRDTYHIICWMPASSPSTRTEVTAAIETIAVTLF